MTPDAILNAARIIDRERGARLVEKPPMTGVWPHDLGCETQLLLALAVLTVEPDVTGARLCDLVRVQVIDRQEFLQILECAASAKWVDEKMDLIRRAAAALRPSAPLDATPVATFRRAGGC